MSDRRRRQWVPISSSFAFGRTGLRLREEFGRDGLLVWICYLAACKRNWIQGQLTYTSESDAWKALGLYGDLPAFTLETFFTFTGRLKQTSRRRSGDLTDVVCTHWQDWNDDIKRDLEAARNRRKRGANATTSDQDSANDEQDIVPTEYDNEIENDVETPQTPLSGNQKNIDKLECMIRNTAHEYTDTSLLEELHAAGINGAEEQRLLELAHSLRGDPDQDIPL